MGSGDSSRIAPSRTGSGRGIAVGVGGTLLLVVALVFGPDAVDALTGRDQDTGSGSSAEQEREQRCRTGGDASQYTDCRMIAAAQSLGRFWDEYLPRTVGEAYVVPDLDDPGSVL